MMTKPRYILEAERLLGVKETKGKLATEEIKDLYKDAGHPEVQSDEVPWCAAFVGACLVRANKPSTGTLLARDYLKYGTSLGKKPKKYSIGIKSRAGSGWEGHVGFVEDFDKDYVWLLGGNQSDMASVQKYKRSEFLGFVEPKEKEADIQMAGLVGDSRRLKVQTWFERIYAIGAAALATVWQFSNEIVNLAKDNAGIALLGLVGFGWLGLRLLKVMSFREYREGRYLPKKQWKD